MESNEDSFGCPTRRAYAKRQASLLGALEDGQRKVLLAALCLLFPFTVQHPDLLRREKNKTEMPSAWTTPDWEVFKKFGPPGLNWSLFMPDATNMGVVPKVKGKPGELSRAAQRERKKEERTKETQRRRMLLEDKDAAQKVVMTQV